MFAVITLRMSKLPRAVFVFFAMVGSVGACATGGDGGAGAHHDGPDDGGPSFDPDGFSGEVSTCQRHCGADLHSVLGCNDEVAMKCPDDKGCSNGECVDACKSAEANKSTIGCEYYAFFFNNPTRGGMDKSCYAAFVANTWGAPVSIHIDRAGTSVDAAPFSYLTTGSGKSITYKPLPDGKLPPNEVAIVFLSGDPKADIQCPAGVTTFASDQPNPDTGIGDAFHIITSAPVVAYDIFPYGGGSSEKTSASLLIPTAAWDTNYVAVAGYKQSTMTLGDHPSIGIVAAEDDTTVTISASVPVEGGNGLAPAPAHKPTQYKLGKGKVLTFSQPRELTGSVIQSDKPIGSWGGSSCINIPAGVAACDTDHQQIPPVRALGHEYVGVRYRNRIDGHEESPPWHMVGAVDGTTLTWDPAPPPGAPTTLGLGEMVEFMAPGGFSVKSQGEDHPFYMSAYMTGCKDVAPTGTNCPGDPEFVNVIPPQQYLSSYVFFTDPTYSETNLVMVRAKDGKGFHDVKLDCAGIIQGWAPIGSSGNYEYARIDLVRHNFVGQNGCNNGRHKIESDAPFGLTVWGWGSSETQPDFNTEAVSYAYPAGASLQSINKVVVPPPIK